MFATQEATNILKPFAKILGPKGLFPNVKVGTLIQPNEDLAQVLRQAKEGQVEFRVDSGANIHSALGKTNFETESVIGNMNSFMKALIDKKPPSLKGTYLKTAFLKSTMGPRFRLNLETIDPRSRNYQLNTL